MNRLSRITLRIWESPTFMTWGSLLSKSLSPLLVLPLILTQLSTEEVALWFLFASAFILQLQASLGFSQTFIRLFAFATGGADIDSLKSFSTLSSKEVARGTNWKVIEKIFATMQYIFTRLTLVALVFMLVSTYFMIKPIEATANASESWIAWWLVLLGSFITLRGSVFGIYLEGLNKVALVRRWDALINIFGIFSNFIVLTLTGNLLMLVISHQFWMSTTVFRNWWLTKKENEKNQQSFSLRSQFYPKVFDAAWSSAWRSGLGTFMSLGILQISNLLYAQVGSSANIAAYLMSFNLLKQIDLFSRAPFYSKLPFLSKLRVQGDTTGLKKESQKAMFLTYWTFILAVLGLVLFGNLILEYIGSNISLVSPFLMTFIALGLLLERYGAMHIQLYSTTNHIVWHIANGVTGMIYIVVLLLLFTTYDVYAFPVAILVSNLGFYAIYCARKSYHSINETFWSFDTKIFLPAIASMTLGTIYLFFYT